MNHPTRRHPEANLLHLPCTSADATRYSGEDFRSSVIGKLAFYAAIKQHRLQLTMKSFFCWINELLRPRLSCLGCFHRVRASISFHSTSENPPTSMRKFRGHFSVASSCTPKHPHRGSKNESELQLEVRNICVTMSSVSQRRAKAKERKKQNPACSNKCSEISRSPRNRKNRLQVSSLESPFVGCGCFLWLRQRAP